jgi:hypothetical protein
MEENKQKLTEVCRSFSRTVQISPFEPRNFFCSQKLEVPIEELESASNQCFYFCKQQVERDAEQYIKEHIPQSEKIINAETMTYEEQSEFDKVADKTGMF